MLALEILFKAIEKRLIIIIKANQIINIPNSIKMMHKSDNDSLTTEVNNFAQLQLLYQSSSDMEELTLNERRNSWKIQPKSVDVEIFACHKCEAKFTDMILFSDHLDQHDIEARQEEEKKEEVHPPQKVSELFSDEIVIIENENASAAQDMAANRKLLSLANRNENLNIYASQASNFQMPRQNIAYSQDDEIEENFNCFRVKGKSAYKMSSLKVYI